MLERAIITSCSNKFFPSVINLLGSIKKNYPNHPKIFVYDLGLLPIFRGELKNIENLEVVEVPPFVSFWRSCYTWKTYIYTHPVAKLNFYLDAGCQVLKPLDEIFIEVEQKDFFVINQGIKFGDIVPKEYKSIFQLDHQYDDEDTVHAGEIGFKANSSVTPLFENVFESAIAGLALGFSPGDRWRNKGKDKNPHVRNCAFFRHDMTLLNIWFKKFFGKNILYHNAHKYAGGKDSHPDQVISNLRLSFKKLDYLNPLLLHKSVPFLALINRGIINILIILKNVNLWLKISFGIIKKNKI